MKVVVLCGGKGVRSFPFTSYLPKPMMPLGGTPIITHVIKSMIQQGFTDFILAAGYRKSVLDDYFEGKDIGARIRIVDTGEHTDTGGRVLACREMVGDRFLVIYGDGLCDVPLDKVQDFHRGHGGLMTVTTVLVRSQYGLLTIGDDGCVTEMREKPLLGDQWVNAGFMVCDKRVFDHWRGESLERHVLPSLVERNMLYSYRHRGFFKSVDSYKDLLEFEELFCAERQPWHVPVAA